MSIFNEPFVDEKMKKKCIEDHQDDPNHVFKCNAPIQSGYYGLRFLGSLLTQKDINCDVTTDFKLDNCSHNEVNFDLLKSYMFKQCNLGRYNNVPFYLFLLNKILK